MFEYKNKFNLSRELKDSISKIITEKEKENYICDAICLTVDQHNDYINYFDEVNNIKRLKVIKRGKKSYSYLVIGLEEKINELKNKKFNTKEELDRDLLGLTNYFEEYNGIFDSKDIYEKYIYLKDFFNSIDIWRIKNDRVTIDKYVIDENLNKVLSKNNV